jgi:Family of unknown function (DUF6328)
VTDRSSEAEDQRDETAAERLDRNTMELLNELRVAGTGIQVMFAFLALLAQGFVGILVLLSDVVLGGAGPVIIGGLTAAFLAGVWFVLPIVRREEE